MKTVRNTLVAGAVLALMHAPAMADDVEGKLESVNAAQQSLVVQGIVFQVTENTDFDDGLKGLADLRPGQMVEVDFEYRDGRHIATEIELED